MAVPGGLALALSAKRTLLCLPPGRGGWKWGREVAQDRMSKNVVGRRTLASCPFSLPLA